MGSFLGDKEDPMTQTTDKFLDCLPYVLDQESPDSKDWSNPKNYSDDPHDPGGETMNGIIQSEYDIYRKQKKMPVQSVKLITQQEGYDIYRTNYWLPYCPLLAPGVDLSFFDASVNEGTHEAIKILQVALDIDSDGAWGPQTALAARAIVNPTLTINAFTARRKAVYKQMKDYEYFGTDWERRATEIGAESLKMVTT